MLSAAARQLYNAWPACNGLRRFSVLLCPESGLHFTGSPLNRASDLRSDERLIAAQRRGHGARYALFSSTLNPLVQSVTNGGRAKFQVVWLSYEELSALPGCDVETSILLGTEPHSGECQFAIALCNVDDEATVAGIQGRFEDARAAFFNLSREEAAQLGQARSLLHWSSVSRYCSMCGNPTQPVNAGWKKLCTDPQCSSHKEVNNISFPRSDPTVITLVLNNTKTRCLLGRQRRFPPNVYSCLAGFVEPGESIEEAARREVLEESGVLARGSHTSLLPPGVDIGLTAEYRFSQPWPFPASLMLGMVAIAQTEEIHLDDELEDAKWWAIDEVRAAIHKRHSASLTGDRFLLLPPRVAIANQLIRSWALPGE